MPNVALERLAKATANKGNVMASPLQARVRRRDSWNLGRSIILWLA